MPTPRGKGLQVDVQVTVDGAKKRYRQIVHCTMPEAEAYEAQVKADLLAGREPAKWGRKQLKAAPTGILLEAALEATWQRYWANAACARTVRSNMLTCVEFFGGDKPITEITTNDADDFIDHLKKGGLAASTIRQKASVMTKMFTHYHRRGNVQVKPYFDLPKVGDNLRDRVITEHEEQELLEVFATRYDHVIARRSDGPDGADLEDLMVILIDTGARRSEVEAIHMKNLRGDLLTLRRTKNDLARTIPLTERAMEALKRQAERHGDEPFNWATKGTVRHAWDWARGCMNKSDDAGFIPYALRHTCATRLYSKTKDLLVVQRWLGHKDIKMTLRYAKLMPGDLEAARDLLQAA